MVLLGTEKIGGLFDFDGTLPVIVIQLIIFMFVLNSILYTPLLDAIENRNIYIKESLNKATDLLAKSKELNTKYEEKAAKARKAAKLDLLTYQIFYKDILDEKMKSSQKSIDSFLIETTKNLEKNKDNILESFDTEIDSLSTQIITKILN